MDTLQDIISMIKKVQKQNDPLNYHETILVLKAIKRISAEKTIVEKLISLIYFSKENTQKIKSLSRRESEIFKLIGLGFSSREISEMLIIQETTVSTHRKNIIKKLHVTGAGQLQKVSIQFVQSQV